MFPAIMIAGLLGGAFVGIIGTECGWSIRKSLLVSFLFVSLPVCALFAVLKP